MGMIMSVFVAPWCAEEGHEHQTPGIEAGEHRRDDQHPEGVLAKPATKGKGAFHHCVLGEEPGEAEIGGRDTDPGDRQRPNHHCPERVGDLLPKAAIVPHVLLMMHRMDDGPRAQEEHRLEEGMGEEVEHGNRVDADARGHEHVTKLRTGRIGDDPFDIVLHQPHSGGEERRGRADQDDEIGRKRRVFHDRRHPAD